jgi:hypothetical protein
VVTSPTNLDARPSARPLPIPLRRRLGALRESTGPWLLGLLAGVALWWWNPPTVKTAMAVERLLSGSIDAGAVLAGFQVTALTLLLSIADKPIVKRLKESNHYIRLIAFHWQAIIALFIWLLASLALLAIQGGTLDGNGKCADLGSFTRWSSILLVVTMVAATCASFRVTRLLVRLLRASSTP